MIPYILHVTVITTICFLFYKLLLQKETFYHLNRWTLLGCLAVSFTLPLLPAPPGFSWRERWEEKSNNRLGERWEGKTNDSRRGNVVDNNSDRPATQATAHIAGIQRDASVQADERTPAFDYQQPAQHKMREKAQVPRSHKSKQHKVTALHDAPPVSQRVNSKTVAKASSQAAQGVAATAKTGVAAGTKTGAAGSAQTGVATGTKTDATGSTKTDAAGAVLFLIVQWLFYGYLFGLLLFGGRFVLQIAVLMYQSYFRPVIRDGRFRIVEVKGNRAPCSFGNTIFINPENYDWETYNQILIHEKIHVSGRHTLDILLAETAVVLQWFNPFVWLYRREVENNLEFLTDASVLLHREVERSAYQLSLLRVSAPHLPFSITNNYNQSLLKRRIVMMNSQRSSLHTVWKYFFLIPLLSVLVCVLNKPAALAAERPALSDHSRVSADANVNADDRVSSLRLPTLLASVVSAFTDTTIRPAAGEWHAAHDASEGHDSSSRGRRAADDDDDQGLMRAYGQTDADAQARLTYQLANDVKMQIQLQLKDQQLMASNLKLDMLNKDLVIRDIQPVIKLNLQNQLNLDTQKQLQLNMQRLQIQPKLNFDIGFPRVELMGDSDLREGAWFATSSDDKLSFELKAGDDDHSWNSMFSVPKSEINPFPGQGNVEFKLVREAGTMTFKGQFDGQEGFGHFKYTPDEGYLDAIKKMGVEDVDDRRQFAWFTLNIKKDYVNMLVHNGFPHISQRDVMSMAAMKIDKDFIDYWHGSDLTDDNPRNLISLKAMKIDRAYVDDLKAAGYDHLSLRDLMSLKAQHIDGAYIRSMGHNSDNTPIPVRELISYKVMHIDSGYLEGLRKVGYGDLPRNEVMSLYSMHVTPEYIKSLQDLGYKDIPVRDLTGLKAMDITPDYIKGFNDVGYKDLPLRQLSVYRSMHITPEYIKQFGDIGYKDLEPRQLTSFKAMDITPDFVKGFRDLGYTDLSAGELSQLKAMNITPDFVKAFNQIGFDHIPVHLLTSLKATGVNADYVSKMKEKGFVSKDLNKYIRLKNDFN